MNRTTRHVPFRALVALGVLALGTGCASAPIQPWSTAPDARDAARQILAAAVVEQGGNLFDEVADLEIAFVGRWGRLAPLIQPVLADRRFRTSSVERYLLAEGSVLQKHSGPAGTKMVRRLGAVVEVERNGEREENHEDLVTAALVADVYRMLVTGPSFFQRDGVEIALGGHTPEHHRLLAVVRPGFGFSREDRAELWIDRATQRLTRVQFTLNGYHPTQGAEVDVRFFDHERIDGYLWPTRYVERIRRPLDVFAHRWTLESVVLEPQRPPESLFVGRDGNESTD